MKCIYLLRHAKSSWDEPGLSDHDRPLAPRGRKAARRMRAYLAAEGIRPQLVLCSSSLRTRETLERILPALAGARIVLEEDLYAAGEGRLLERLRRLSEPDESVMVIAHNPGLEHLARVLARDPSGLGEKFPTGALATLAFDGAWAGLGPGRADLVDLVLPRALP